MALAFSMAPALVTVSISHDISPNLNGQMFHCKSPLSPDSAFNCFVCVVSLDTSKIITAIPTTAFLLVKEQRISRTQQCCVFHSLNQGLQLLRPWQIITQKLNCVLSLGAALCPNRSGCPDQFLRFSFSHCNKSKSNLPIREMVTVVELLFGI